MLLADRSEGLSLLWCIDLGESNDEGVRSRFTFASGGQGVSVCDGDDKTSNGECWHGWSLSRAAKSLAAPSTSEASSSELCELLTAWLGSSATRSHVPALVPHTLDTPHDSESAMRVSNATVLVLAWSICAAGCSGQDEMLARLWKSANQPANVATSQPAVPSQ